MSPQIPGSQKGLDAVLKRTAGQSLPAVLEEVGSDLDPGLIAQLSSVEAIQVGGQLSDQFDFSSLQRLLDRQRGTQPKRPYRIGSDALRELAS